MKRIDSDLKYIMFLVEQAEYYRDTSSVVSKKALAQVKQHIRTRLKQHEQERRIDL